MPVESDYIASQDTLTRARWGFKELLYIFFIRLLVGAFLSRVVYPLAGGEPQVWVTLVERGLTIFLIIFFVSRVSGNWWSAIGLTRQSFSRHLLVGVIAGAALLTILTIGEKIMFHLAVTGFQEHPLISSAKGAASVWKFLLPLFAGGLITPVAEEMLYRGMLYPVLAKSMGIFLGILNSSLIFTLFHFSTYWFVEILFTGIVLTVLYWRTGSLIPGITAHAAVNSWRLIAAWLF